MTDLENNFYSETHDADQRRFAERRLAAQRDGLVGDIGKLTMLAVTVGTTEPAPITHHYDTYSETPQPELSVATEKHRAALARTSLGELIGRDQPRVTLDEHTVLGHAA